MTNSTPVFFFVATLALMAAMGTPARAIVDVANDEAAEEGQESSRIFEAAFFEPYAPVTALDMVSRIPGFTLNGGDTSRRGLSDSFGNLFVNGARPSNKSVALETVLQRIAAADVIRIELIQDDAIGLNRRGYAQVINIILREQEGLSGSYQLLWQHLDSGRSMPSATTSITLPFAGGELTTGLDISLWPPRFSRQRSVFDGSENLMSSSDEYDQVFDRGLTPTLSFVREMENGGRLRVDSEFYVWSYHRNFFQTTSLPDSGNLKPFQSVSSITEDHGSSYNLSGTYEFPIAANLSSRSILLASREIANNGPERLEVHLAASGFSHAEIFSFANRQEEYAFRQSLNWVQSDAHTFEAGIEAALNRGDTQLSIDQESRLGVITPVILPVSDTQIEERRSEMFLQDTWIFDDALTVTSGIRWEYSQLALSGDATLDRNFSYLKPSVTIDYRRNDEDRFRLSLRRDVDQLDFSKFASSVDLTDNNATIGNPNYVPQSSWIAEAEFERRWSETSTLLLTLDYVWVSDIDDWIPVQSGTAIYDAPGNLGDGQRFRLQAEYSTALDAIGIEEAQLDIEYTFQNTRLTDPLIGRSRAWSGERDHAVSVTFQQSFPARRLAWGWDYRWQSDAVTFRALERHVDVFPSGSLNAYIETSRWSAATLRFGVRGILDVSRERRREVYNSSRASGVIDQIEARTSDHGVLIYLQLTGTF